jgi:hypothetical protein
MKKKVRLGIKYMFKKSSLELDPKSGLIVGKAFGKNPSIIRGYKNCEKATGNIGLWRACNLT